MENTSERYTPTPGAAAPGVGVYLSLVFSNDFHTTSKVYTHLGPGLWKPNWVGVGVACRVTTSALETKSKAI